MTQYQEALTKGWEISRVRKVIGVSGHIYKAPAILWSEESQAFAFYNAYETLDFTIKADKCESLFFITS